MSSTPKKITELTNLTTSVSSDVIVIVDISEDETKKQTKENFLQEVQGEINDHVSDKNNPHEVTAEQVGAEVGGAAAIVQGNLDDHEDDFNNPHQVDKNDVGLGNVPNLDTTSAVNNQHTHSNKSTLDLITESFTTALKSSYDGAVSWISTNGTNILNHIINTSNPHGVTKTQVGLGNVTNDTQIPASEKGANSGVATLDSGGKVPAGQLPNTVMEYKGNWNAFTNSPTLIDGTGNAGDVYRASVAGTQNLGSGSQSFALGDFIIYSGTIWEKSVNSNSVDSVNGQQGVVVLDTGDISDVSDKRYVTETEKTLISTALQAGDYVITILEKTSGDIDDINTSFTFSKEPTEIIINGVSYRKNHGWTWSVLTATLTYPVGIGGDIYGRI